MFKLRSEIEMLQEQNTNLKRLNNLLIDSVEELSSTPNTLHTSHSFPKDTFKDSL